MTTNTQNGCAALDSCHPNHAAFLASAMRSVVTSGTARRAMSGLEIAGGGQDRHRAGRQQDSSAFVVRRVCAVTIAPQPIALRLQW